MLCIVPMLMTLLVDVLAGGLAGLLPTSQLVVCRRLLSR